MSYYDTTYDFTPKENMYFQNNKYLLNISSVLLVINMGVILSMGHISPVIFPIIATINQYVGGALVFTVLLSMYHYKQGPQTEVVLFGVWLVWALTGFFVSMNINLFLDAYSTTLQSWLLGLCAATIASIRRDLKVNAIAFLPAAIISILLSISSGQLSLSLQGIARFIAINNSANTTGGVLLTSIALIFYYYGTTKNRSIKNILITSIIFLSVLLVLTGSRKNALGLPLIVLLYIFLTYGINTFYKSKGILLLALTLIIIIVSIPIIETETIIGKRFTEVVDNPYSEQKRMLMYVDGWDLFVKHPVFGVGLGNYRAYSWYGGVSHSDYIEVLSSTGILGFILYASILIIGIKTLFMARKMPLNDIERNTLNILIASFITDLILNLGKSVYMSPINLFVLFTYFGYAHGMLLKYRRRLIN